MRKSILAQGPTETEVKIAVSDRSRILQQLERARFRISVPRTFEANTLYDTPDKALQSGGTMLRLRQAGERAVITWKGPKILGPHKSRRELETSIGSHEILHAILTEIGFRPSFRYEKFRTEFQDDSQHGVVTVDETPIGLFLELEGGADWIDSTAHRLGYSSADYLLDSYGKLYLADCENRRVKPVNMVFGSGAIGT